MVIGYVAIAFTGNTHRVLSTLSGTGRVGFVPLWIIAIAVLVIALAIGGSVLHLLQRRATRRTADALGLRYARQDPGFTTRWKSRPFGQGRSRKAFDVLSGTVRGRSCAMFHYRYTTGSGDDSTTTTLSVVTVSLGFPLPPMSVGPEKLVGIVAPGLTRMDIDIEDETFNRYHRVYAKSRQYAVAMLNPRAVEGLLAVEPFYWQVLGSDLVASGPRTSVQQLRARAEALVTIADNVPSFLRTDSARGH